MVDIVQGEQGQNVSRATPPPAHSIPAQVTAAPHKPRTLTLPGPNGQNGWPFMFLYSIKFPKLYF